MSLKVLRFIALMLAALGMAMGMAHLLELVDIYAHSLFGCAGSACSRFPY